MRRLTFPVAVLILLLVALVSFLVGRAGLDQLCRENTKLIELNRDLEQKAGPELAALFFVKSTPKDFYLQPWLTRLEGKGEVHLRALEALFAGPPAGSGLLGIFPAGVHVLGLEIKDGTAVVNLNLQATRLNVGSRGEALAVASIVNTLTKFPDIYRVKFLVEGKEVESLAGHVDLTGVFRYNDQVLKVD
jgi:spore germination protein GerM